MAESYFPFDAGAGANINEQQWRELALALNSVGAGVIPNQDNELQITGQTDGLFVHINTGRCGCFGHYYRNTADIKMTVPQNNTGNVRVDTVVINFNFAANTAAAVLRVGTAVPATLTQNIATSWDVVLGYIRLGGGVQTVADSAVYAALDRFGSGVASTLPIGSIIETGLSLAPALVPSGFVPCDGQSYYELLLPKLAGVVGPPGAVQMVPDKGSNEYGLDVNGLLWVPDHRERVAVGSEDMDTDQGPSFRGIANSLGHVGGAAVHTLSVNEMPAHHHHPIIGADSHFMIFEANRNTANQVNGGLTNDFGGSKQSTTDDTGGGAAHNNVQPYASVNKLLKVC